MTTTLAARPFEARITPADKRARALVSRLHWAVFAMVLLNAVVWGGMIAALRGVLDPHGLVDQVWAWSATWLATLPHVSITISH
ncbi:hypothetical protein PMI01_02853 [Caulobacter sp. AP07]|uniref:hypothetical protein n=1 Tax=Caulobacter sp. AP07 TaxID=1144304 RepID=UPI0002722547|nr:hypothetical protein [Caulobacter sp. AP07]EJL31189.1 hypothetical protein PMI01_02853 [Caulobacter sp. AP07]